jgi:PPOX class probable F420-dependent enzyme
MVDGLDAPPRRVLNLEHDDERNPMPKGPSPPELDEVLARQNPAVIATLNRDGRPNTVATWYLWEDGRALVSMDESQVRLANIRRDPRVALTILDQDNWFGHTSLRGRVVALEDDANLDDMDRLAQRYIGQPYPMRDRPRVSAWIEVDSWHRRPPG